MKNPRSPTDIALDRHLSPVNRTAGLVTSRGEHWQPKKKVQTVDSENPIPFGPVDDKSEVRAGMRFGSLTVWGRATGEEFRCRTKGAAYVCRCVCGYYTVRRARAVLNPANKKDACARCLEKQYQDRHREYRTFGRNLR